MEREFVRKINVKEGMTCPSPIHANKNTHTHTHTHTHTYTHKQFKKQTNKNTHAFQNKIPGLRYFKLIVGQNWLKIKQLDFSKNPEAFKTGWTPVLSEVNKIIGKNWCSKRSFLRVEMNNSATFLKQSKKERILLGLWAKRFRPECQNYLLGDQSPEEHFNEVKLLKNWWITIFRTFQG